ncbi:MAG TPA: STAS domain-containing protein [Anaerolineales bacterium]|nr:STAS domain-containing protein [Anaerolineales bacterium]
MEITQSEAQGSVPVTIFHIDGAFNADEPLATMVKAAVAGGARNILLDLTGVTYISSAGLRVLHTTYTLLRDASETQSAVSQGLREGSYYSPHLKLLKPSKMAKEVLQMSGYDMFLESFTDQKKAVDSF